MRFLRSVRAALAAPESVEGLQLRLARQRLLPDALGDLPRLREISLEVGPRFDMAGALRTLSRVRSLRTLRFQYTETPALPDEIGLMQQLTRLDLWDTQTPHISPVVFGLTRLEVLMLRGVQLSQVPAEIGALSSLTTLCLSRCPLTALPPELGKLQRLLWLYLWETPLTTLPPEIGLLPALVELQLTDTPLTALPPLPHLKGLRLRRGQLSEAVVRAALSPDARILWEDVST